MRRPAFGVERRGWVWSNAAASTAVKIRRGLAAALAALTLSAPAGAEPVGPILSAASNFAQVWRPADLDAAAALGVRDLRDAVYWAEIERPLGRYDWSRFTRSWPALLPPRDMTMSLTVNNPHPDVDGGETPHTDAGRAAWAAFAAAAAVRFPAVHSVEVGNEMNSARFVSGPLETAPLAERAALYTALLAETARAVRAVRPEVRILGGAAHSLSLSWLGALAEAGAPAHMDALAVHPYTTDPEQLAPQVALLRALPGFADMPLEVTEFGTEDALTAADDFLRAYCQMGLVGVVRAVWYPLTARGDGLIPLMEGGAATDVGLAYRLAAARMEGRALSDAAPDPFTYGCAYEGGALVLWGAPRSVTLAPGVRAVDATGADWTGPPTLSRDGVLVLLDDGAAPVLGDTVRLAPQRLRADNVDQFAYPGQPGDPFQRVLRQSGREWPLELRPGQEKPGVPWTPYLATARDGVARAGPGWVLPSRWDSGPLDMVQRHVASEAGRQDVTLEVEVAERSEDGIDLRVTLDGADLLVRRIDGAERIVLADVARAAGSVLEVVVGPGDSARGDVTALRITLSDPAGP
ncbi:hypothetical protein DXV76_02155 [Rhodobacteraceae bacterium CCMM004]|nr:hypothetical protein DXV76_02155 [Rhodobacteraceae bacterium CCMM004]